MDKEWNRELDHPRDELMVQETRSEDGQLFITLMLRIVELLDRLEPMTRPTATAAEKTGSG